MSNVIEVENFLPAEIITELVSTANNSAPSLYKSFNGLRSRLQLDLENYLVERNLKEYCNSIIQPTVDFPTICTSATIWKDNPGFFMKSHKDNFSIILSIQIYLNNNNCPGTLFEMDDSTKLIKYGYNRGYILHNYMTPRVKHYVPYQPNSESRLSVYILFHKLDEHGKPIYEENEQETWKKGTNIQGK